MDQMETKRDPNLPMTGKGCSTALIFSCVFWCCALAFIWSVLNG